MNKPKKIASDNTSLHKKSEKKKRLSKQNRSKRRISTGRVRSRNSKVHGSGSKNRTTKKSGSISNGSLRKKARHFFSRNNKSRKLLQRNENNKHPTETKPTFQNETDKSMFTKKLEQLKSTIKSKQEYLKTPDIDKTQLSRSRSPQPTPTTANVPGACKITVKPLKPASANHVTSVTQQKHEVPTQTSPKKQLSANKITTENNLSPVVQSSPVQVNDNSSKPSNSTNPLSPPAPARSGEDDSLDDISSDEVSVDLLTTMLTALPASTLRSNSLSSTIEESMPVPPLKPMAKEKHRNKSTPNLLTLGSLISEDDNTDSYQTNSSRGRRRSALNYANKSGTARASLGNIEMKSSIEASNIAPPAKLTKLPFAPSTSSQTPDFRFTLGKLINAAKLRAPSRSPNGSTTTTALPRQSPITKNPVINRSRLRLVPMAKPTRGLVLPLSQRNVSYWADHSHTGSLQVVPQLVQRCVQNIEAKLHKDTGKLRDHMYTINKVPSDGVKILRDYEKNPSNLDTHSLKALGTAGNCVILKIFLQNFVTPSLLPTTECQKLIDRIRGSNKQITREQLAGILEVTRLSNGILLNYVLTHLKKVSQHSRITGMTVFDLAKSWTLSLCYSAAEYEYQKYKPLSRVILYELIEFLIVNNPYAMVGAISRSRPPSRSPTQRSNNDSYKMHSALSTLRR